MNSNGGRTVIIGGGVTGLAAGLASGLPVYEAAEYPGGICSSYYVRPGTGERLHSPPPDGEAYRFEIGGGHWIFGGDPAVLRFLRMLAPVRTYCRRSSVYFRASDSYVPFPLQDNLRFLPGDIAGRALAEMAQPNNESCSTAREWLAANFGPTLCELFFFPFHELYTAGLYRAIAPQDGYKTPVRLKDAIRGAFGQASPAGYNVNYLYPGEGLNTLTARMAERADVRYGKRVVRIEPHSRELYFADDSVLKYERLICTVPLNMAVQLAGLAVDARPDPYTAVLVLNIGATRGPKCPGDHWLYTPDAKSGFHRVGFYSNIDDSFLPRAAQGKHNRTSIYVERAYIGGHRPSDAEIAAYQADVEEELRNWEFIEDVEVDDPTWIDVAYTWAWPGSEWRIKAMRVLEEADITPVGRYARWIFQGIADSLRDGFMVGGCFRSC